MGAVEVRLFVRGKEVSVDTFVESVVRQVRAAVRDEIAAILGKQQLQNPHASDTSFRADLPRRAVSVREAARLLSISVRTVDKYIALKAIRTVRVGRRVLVPMTSVNEVARNGIRNRADGTEFRQIR